MNFIKKIFSTNNNSERKLTRFVNVGFHGDEHLMDVVKFISKRCSQFIETGTNVGSTLCYYAKLNPQILCYSCEPHKESFDFAFSKISSLPNVILKNELSPEFLYDIIKINPEITEKETLFWLDSHGFGFKWPLKKEIECITEKFKSGYIIIDDFQVPNQPQFGYDEYNNQICSLEYILSSFKKNLKYWLFFPNYTDKTSQFVSLRGWVVIDFGHEVPINFPLELKKITFQQTQ